MMGELNKEFEAESLDEARNQAKSQVSEGLQIISEKVLSDGKTIHLSGIIICPT